MEKNTRREHKEEGQRTREKVRRRGKEMERRKEKMRDWELEQGYGNDMRKDE